MTISSFARWIAVAALGFGLGTGAQAQIRTVDPNNAMQRDLAPVPVSEADYGTRMDVAASPPPAAPAPDGSYRSDAPARRSDIPADQSNGDVHAQAAPAGANGTRAGQTYEQKDVLDAAEGVFGKGAEGLAKLVEKILAEQGRPNAYIAGREVGGAFVVGLRYGSGVLHHKVEGDMPIYWTGPSLGFDLGANGAKTFVLIYNLYDTHDLYRRFPAAEGNVYVVGGFTASYLRRGDVVVIPIRLGVGWRLGVNVGYMKFSHKSKIMPF